MEELDLKELFQMFWERKVQILLIIAIFMAIGVIYSLGFVTPKYQSKTTLLLATNNSSGEKLGGDSITTTDVTLNSKLVSTYSELVGSSKIIREVISNLGIKVDEDSIKNNVTVKAKSDTEVIEITVRNENPKLAAQIANEIAKVFIQNVKEYYKIDNLHVVDKAEEESEPYNMNLTKDVVIFAFIGVVVASIYVLIANMLDTTIKSQEDIEKIAGVTVLASFPMYDGTEESTRGRRGGRR